MRRMGCDSLEMQRADKPFCATTPKLKLYTMTLRIQCFGGFFHMYIIQDFYVHVKALFK
jgi:hypothetical protein